MGRSLLIGLVATVCFVCGLSAQEAFDADPVLVELVSDADTIAAGEPFQVAICLKIQEHWHSYWKNPGDAGLPTDVVWDLPSGFDVSEMSWPAPERFVDEMGVGYGYEDSVCFFAEIVPPKDLSVGEVVDLRAEVRWMACGESCIPGLTDVALSLPVGDVAVHSVEWKQQVEQFAEALPAENPALEMIEEAERVVFVFEREAGAPPIEEAYFFVEDPGAVDPASEQTLTCTGGKYILAVDRASAAPAGEPLRGVLVLAGSDARSISAWEVGAKGTSSTLNSSLGGATAGAIPAGDGADLTFGLAILMALAGGLILNLMPCVLPVISFKVMGFINIAGEDRREIFKHSFSFFAGVLISFWVLAGALLALRSYGQLVGWGFQLQEPIFVGLLAACLVVFAMSLFGVFELGAGVSSWAGSGKLQQKGRESGGLVSSFMSGVLATAVATPCTGPFLGTTLGFAVTLSNAGAMLIFTAMGVGMALPYLLLGIFPSLLRFLPKPGPWMMTFKEVMGFIIVATVLWLVWVFGALTGTQGMFLLLVGFTIACVASWVYGRWGTPATKKGKRRFATAVAAVLLVVSFSQVISASRMVDAGGAISSHDGMDWEPFSMERVEDYGKQGVPVFIDFTAKWCLICQANKAVLHSDAVVTKFREKGVVTMMADWTRSDPEITKALRKFGRNGVPLYVLYNPTNVEPTIFPQVLTPEVVLSSLESLQGPSSSHSVRRQLVEAEAEADGVTGG